MSAKTPDSRLSVWLPAGTTRLNSERPAQGATHELQGSHLTIIWICSLAAGVADLAAKKTLLEVLVEVILDTPKTSL